MSGISVRRICRATGEHIDALAGMAGVAPQRLKEKYFGHRNEIVIVYGAVPDDLVCLGRAADAAGIDYYRCGDIRGEYSPLPSLLLAGAPLELERLAAELDAEREELAGAFRRCLSGGRQESWRVAGGRELELGRPLIMGILNLTPDSFYSGSRSGDMDEVLRRAERMAREGADIIDIGGESTRPGAEPVSEDEEIRRVAPVVEMLVAELGELPVSVDTYKAEVARAALESGASIVNDIGAGLLDGRMLETVARSGAGYVLMHMRGKPRTMQQDTVYEDLPGDVFSFFRAGLDRCAAAGIGLECVALDPGIGFGKPPAGNYELLARLGEFHSLGRPLLVGSSRKSFLSLAGQDDPAGRLEGSLAACTVAVMAGAGILRVHDVGSSRRAALTAGVFAGIAGPL